MKSITIKGSKRESVGKSSSKALRNAGRVPCVLYGGDEPFHFSALELDFSKLVYTANAHTSKLIIVSPDVGGVVRARAFAKRLGVDLVIIDKRRDEAGTSAVVNVIGNVKDKICLLVDDIVDSAGTLCNAAKALKDKGALEVYSYITHGVLSGKASERIYLDVVDRLINNKVSNHKREDYHLNTERSYREDGITVK